MFILQQILNCDSVGFRDSRKIWKRKIANIIDDNTMNLYASVWHNDDPLTTSDYWKCLLKEIQKCALQVLMKQEEDYF